MKLEALIRNCAEAERLALELLRQAIKDTNDRSFNSDYEFAKNILTDISSIMSRLSARKGNQKRLVDIDEEIDKLFE